MIDLSQELILSLILKAFLTGAILGMTYEGVRIVKMLLGIGRRGRARRICFAVFVFVTDFCFCMLFASAAILLTYNLSGGVFRGCVYLCMGIGFLTYRLTLGRVMEKLELSFVKLIKKLIHGVIRLILKPLRAIFSLICKLYALTIGRIIGTIRCRMSLRREKRKRRLDRQNVAGVLPTGDIADEKKEENDAARASRYKKECRISFGRRRGA